MIAKVTLNYIDDADTDLRFIFICHIKLQI
jgi:hypothetical protein